MKKTLYLLAILFLAGCSSPRQEINLSELNVQSEGYIRLSGESGKFTATVGVSGLDDPKSPLSFYAFTNKGVAFSSGIMKKGDKPKSVDIDLKGVTDLYLVTESPQGGTVFNLSDWTEAVFRVYTRPVAEIIQPEEERYILTPAPSVVPRINGAKIVGASPNKPFLFTIATTGERPIAFAAEGLPEGLNLDTERGIITGAALHAGNYPVTVTATNQKGTCKEAIEIVIGGDLALTPHMGWNSWYIYATGVTQEIMERSAQAMYNEGLVNFGYTYVNIDDGWEIKAGSDDPVIGVPVRHRDGTIRTNKNFPDMKKMTDLIHNLGLKAGLYSSPGRTTCGGYAGSLGYEALDIKTFADWGFDFLKYDWCSYGNEVREPELADYQKPYRQIGRLCRESERDIILNMCQYGMGDVWKWGKEVGGHSWRTTGDIGDTQNLIANMFRIGFFQEQLKDYSGPGGWNDPDYLLFGNIYDWNNKTQRQSPYSASEHYTCMTLWSMMSAPLIFSGDITNLDAFTKNILCNAEVIDVNQDRSGKQGRCVCNRDLVEIWQKELSDGTTAIAVFNKRPVGNKIGIDWEELGYEKGKVRDLWRQKDLGDLSEVTFFDIPRHGCVLLKISQ